MFGLETLVAAGSGLGSAAMDIVGGQLQAAQNRQQQRHSDDMSREFAQNAIQWRVRDARKAGIHPLYAMGTFPNSPPAMVAGDTTESSFREAGQSLRQGVRMVQTSAERQRSDLEDKLLLSQIAESDARRLSILSDTARNNQLSRTNIGIQPEMMGGDMGQAPQVPGSGVVDMKPSEIISSSQLRPSMEAGIRPGEEQRMIGGMPVLLPQLGGESSEEIISEMSTASWAGLLARNSKIYGKGWLEDFLKMRYLGIEPNQYYPSIQEQEKMGKMHVPKSGLDQAVERAIGGYRTYKKRYDRWSRQHPSGRR